MSRKIRVQRTRNAGTMTEAQFFQWIRQKLRKASVYWKPISLVRKEAQVPYKGPNKRRKFSYVCSMCKKEFPVQETNVHHIIECGPLTSFEELAGFTERLFVEKEGLVLLCTHCHEQIHNVDGKHYMGKKRRVVKRIVSSTRGRKKRTTKPRTIQRKTGQPKKQSK